MKCPKCNKEGATYLHREKRLFPSPRKEREKDVTIDRIARCKSCGYEGVI